MKKIFAFENFSYISPYRWIWCVQAVSNCFAKKDYVQSVFAFFKVYLETENWNEEKSRTSFATAAK